MSKIDGSLIHKDDKDLITPGAPNWFFQRYSVEFKRGGSDYDPFNDKNQLQPETATITRADVRGQLFGYVDRMFKYQHRTGHFLLFVNGSEFRVMFWDRSGIVTTEATEYAATSADTEILLRILYGLSKMSAREAGVDGTAVRLPKTSCGWKQMDLAARENSRDVSEVQRSETDPTGDSIPASFLQRPLADAPVSALFEKGLLDEDPSQASDNHVPEYTIIEHLPPTFTYIRELFKESIDGPNQTRYALTVQGRYFLVGAPIYAASGPIGRGTRGFVALEWKAQRLVFLKDSWRPHYVGVSAEGETLEKLNIAGFNYVPTLICHEDMKDPETSKLQETIVSNMRVPTFMTKEPDKSRTMAPLPTRKKAGSLTTTPAAEPRTRSQTAKANATAGPSTVPLPPLPTSGGKRTHDAIQADRPRRRTNRLRHLTHSRVVVAEVCMPSTAYTSSRQLVKIIYECIFGENTNTIRLCLTSLTD